MRRSWYALLLLGSVATAATAVPAEAQAPHTYKGLEVSVSGVGRATNVSLSDCPAGENIVRGVIRPGDAMEFVSVKVDFKVLPAFKAGAVPKPTLTDATGKVYNTAQSFGDIGATPAFACTFAFRVATGTKVAKFTIDTLSIDLGAMGQ